MNGSLLEVYTPVKGGAPYLTDWTNGKLLSLYQAALPHPPSLPHPDAIQLCQTTFSFTSLLLHYMNQ
ncbi:hypothetical protein BACI9J_140549 [Bacillus altitudinis]|nr:hypothetical protein BACI9J_140549 [Bacillus altitudinis]